MTDEEIAELRRYKPAEVVRLLDIPAKRLKTWVQEERVPYQCAGVERGVWFTAEDVRHIGETLPELMGGRRGSHRTGTLAEEQPATAPARPDVTAELIAGWAQLTAHRPRPRSSRPAR